MMALWAALDLVGAHCQLRLQNEGESWQCQRARVPRGNAFQVFRVQDCVTRPFVCSEEDVS